jgi:hypothetical protein
LTEIERLQSELAALKEPPRCQNCGSVKVRAAHTDEHRWFIECNVCLWGRNGYPTIDAALNTWRKKNELTSYANHNP